MPLDIKPFKMMEYLKNVNTLLNIKHEGNGLQLGILFITLKPYLDN